MTVEIQSLQNCGLVHRLVTVLLRVEPAKAWCDRIVRFFKRHRQRLLKLCSLVVFA